MYLRQKLTLSGELLISSRFKGYSRDRGHNGYLSGRYASHSGVNEDWDEDTTRAQITRPDWDFSSIRMKIMHHLPHIFFDTLRPERSDCPVLVPSSFSVSRNKVIAQDIYSYEPCGLPTGKFMPAEKAQIRLMTASPITLRACILAPDQVTPEQAYFKDLDFYKKTLFHTPFLSRGRSVTLLEYRDVLEVDLVLSYTRLPIFLVHQGGSCETSTEQTTRTRNRS